MAEAYCVLDIPALTENHDGKGPDMEEWSMPIKFIVKQRNFVVGEDFLKPKVIDIFVSQMTDLPNEANHEQHQIVRFNFKSKNNYDKEFGGNQVF